MVFRRFFDRGQAPPAGEAAPDEPDNQTLVPEDDAPAPEAAPDHSWAERAAKVIPGGASTASKRPIGLFGSDTPHAPTHFLHAAGCRVVASDGETYVDCTMALGAVALGYAEPHVTRAVLDAVGGGHVAGLSSALEVELAERFCGMVPCAEQVRFLKTGAEATSAAVRIARTYTGRDAVIASGYFGWHDWASDAAGVPAGARQDTIHVPFDDLAALDAAADRTGDRLAAIILEPVVERLPSAAWIARAQAICSQRGAALIFDEMKTGFRLAPGGYQEFSGVTPNLATFGKALANGFPLSAVCGRAELMDAARRTWISSTLAGEAGALAAAYIVLDWHQQADICEALAKNGAEMRRVVSAAIDASGIPGVRLEGLDPMWSLRFDDPAVEHEFLERAMAHGVLFKRGAYNFACVAHDDDAVRVIEHAASASFVEMLERP